MPAPAPAHVHVSNTAGGMWFDYCSEAGATAGRSGRKGEVVGAADTDLPPELRPLLADEEEAEAVLLGLAASRRAESASLGHLEEDEEEPAGCGGCGALAYLSQRRNWDVAMTVWVKATGAMVWGAADVLNGRCVRECWSWTSFFSSARGNVRAAGGPARHRCCLCMFSHHARM